MFFPSFGYLSTHLVNFLTPKVGKRCPSLNHPKFVCGLNPFLVLGVGTLGFCGGGWGGGRPTGGNLSFLTCFSFYSFGGVGGEGGTTTPGVGRTLGEWGKCLCFSWGGGHKRGPPV